MRRVEKMENIKREIISAKIKILGFAETRYKGSEDFYDDVYRILYTEGNECQ